MKKRHVTWLFRPVLGVLVVLGAALALAASAGAASTPVTYTDPAGDTANGAGDITSVAVSNTGDLLTLAITAKGVELADGVTGASVYVWLDTDQDPTTGDPEDGADYGLMYYVDAGGYHARVGHFTPDNDWVGVLGTSMTFAKVGDTATFTIQASDLGQTSAFDFYLTSESFDANGDTVEGDVAPDGEAWWHYTLTAEPVPSAPAEPGWGGAGALAGLLSDGSKYVGGADGMWHPIDPVTFAASGYDANTIHWYQGSLPGTIGSPIPAVTPAPVETPAVVPLAESVKIVPVIGAPTPVKVTAGKEVVITFPVVNGATGEKVTSVTTMSSAPTIGGKLIRPHVERFTDGVASVGLKVPKTMTGHQLKVKVTINTGTTTATRVVTIPVA